MKQLKIPYAIDEQSGAKISAEQIAEIMENISSLLRLQATARRDTARRKAIRLKCPACYQPVYPHAPRNQNARYFWSHFAGDAIACPLETKRKLSPDQINALVFHGRQEGEAHKNLVALLSRFAAADPEIDSSSVECGRYEAPTDEMKAQFPYGRFPDVKFVIDKTTVVVEAQLATITLHGINGRRAFYDHAGIPLLWVMRNFDPTGPLRASVRDIIADQRAILFSIDAEVEALCANDSRFRLRVWTYRAGQEPMWSSSVATIAECIDLVRPRRWCDDFKRLWIEGYKGRSFYAEGAPDADAMLQEIFENARIGPADEKPWCSLSMVRLLISLEAGTVTGSGHTSLVSLANSFHVQEGFRASTLVRKAIEHWRPELLARSSVQRGFEIAGQELAASGKKEWGRKSAIGRIRDALFPDWQL